MALLQVLKSQIHTLRCADMVGAVDLFSTLAVNKLLLENINSAGEINGRKK